MELTLITGLVNGVLSVIMSTIICHILLTRRKSVLYCIFSFTLLTAVLAATIVYLSRSAVIDTSLSKYIVILLIFCYNIYNFIVFKESFAKKLFTMLSIWMSSNAFTLISICILEVLVSGNQISNGDFSLGLMKLFMEQIMRFIQLALFIAIRKTYKHYTQLINDRTVYFMCLYSFIGLLFYYENYRLDFGTYANINYRNLLLFVFFILLGYVNVYIAVASTKRTMVLDNELKIVENQISSQRENYRSLLEFTEERAKLKHDLRHHIFAVNSMVAAGKSDNALQYIQQFNQSEMLKDIPVLCMNLTADAMIKYYMSTASSKGIDFRTKLNIPEDIGINPVDLSVILGNCIENAINACDKLSSGGRKYIEMISNVIGNQLVIKMKNSFNGIIKKDGDTFLSSSHEGCGIGIASLTATAEKYKGDVNIKYDHAEFEVNIILPLFGR